MQNIAANIRTARKRLGITQAQLADRLGIKTGVVNGHENGQHTPCLEILLKYCKALGTAPNDLIGYPPSDPNQPALKRITQLETENKNLRERICAALKALEE